VRTAASIWSVAAIGLATGGGLWFAAVLTTIIILVILIGVKPLEEAYRARVQSAVLSVEAERGAINLDGIQKLLGVRGGQIKRMAAIPGPDDLDRVTLHLVKVSERDIRTSIARLKEEPGVHKVEADRKKFLAGDAA
jgi:putative Mg2+ transporter-C (MgtC) family protein